MSRDEEVVLTPSISPDKIALLSMIAAYCAGILPKQTHRPLLSTIVRYIEEPHPRDGTQVLVTLPTLEEMLRTAKGAVIKADPENGYANAGHLELRVLHALWSLKSLDALHSFVLKARGLLVRNLDEGVSMKSNLPPNAIPAVLLTQKSFLGRYVEQCVQDFELLEFDKADLLWTAFLSFRSPTESLWRELSGDEHMDGSVFTGTGDDPSLLKSLLENLPSTVQYTPHKDVMMISESDMRKLMGHQINAMQTYGAPMSPELREILHKMSRSELGKIPITHYVVFLECLRDGDFEGAFNGLHRYFDYMMGNRSISLYHYALLSLATLYSTFKCEGEAVRAIEESISVARENKDMDCLNYLLIWVFNFLRDRPHLKQHFYISNDQLLQFLKSNAGDTPLHSTAYQSDASQLMLEGGSLSATLESLTKATYISVNGTSNPSGFMANCLLSSAFWIRAGNWELASVYTEISQSFSTSVVQTMENQIRSAHHEFVRGEVEACFKLLDEQKEYCTGDLKLTSILICHKLTLQARQSIRMSKYNQADIYLTKLLAQKHVNIDLQGELYYLMADLQLRRGNMSKAYQIVTEKIEEFAHKATNKYWFLMFSTLKCKIVGMGSAPARALSMAIQCLNSAASSGYTTLTLGALLRLVEVLMSLGEYGDAKDLLSEALPKFESTGDLELKSFAYQKYGDVLLKLYKEGEFEFAEHQKVDIATKIVQCLETSMDGFKHISYLEEIKNCLKLQLETGTTFQHDELVSHAQSALEKIETRIQQELSIY